LLLLLPSGGIDAAAAADNAFEVIAEAILPVTALLMSAPLAARSINLKSKNTVNRPHKKENWNDSLQYWTWKHARI
jgi:hypothetical protein